MHVPVWQNVYNRMFTCVIHFLFIRCEIYLLFYSIFFPCIPAGGTQVLVYTAGHTLTHCGKHLRDVIHLLKEQNTSLSQKRKKKGGGGWSNLNCCIPSVWFKTILKAIICFRLKICILVIFVHFPYMHFLCKYNCAH